MGSLTPFHWLLLSLCASPFVVIFLLARIAQNTKRDKDKKP